jgi:hypothetical protein
LDATQRALPHNRFKLVDLARVRLDDPRGPANCIQDRKHHAVPSVPGRGVIVCPALVYGGDEDEFHTAIVRIEATWARCYISRMGPPRSAGRAWRRALIQ